MPPIVAGPCPDWCTLPEGHPYRSQEELLRLAARLHKAEFDHGVTIELMAYVNFEGVVTVNEEVISISVDRDEVEDLTAGDALNLAAAMELDRITHAS